MTSLARLGAPTEYVNDDLKGSRSMRVRASTSQVYPNLRPDATYGVVVECFDLVTERESKSFAYATNSAGRVVASGKLSPVGEYGKEDALFDLADGMDIRACNRLSLRGRSHRNALRERQPSCEFCTRINPTGEHPGSRVTAPILTHAKDAEFTMAGFGHTSQGCRLSQL